MPTPEPLYSTYELEKPEGAWFDEQAAQEAIEFFKNLSHPQGEWAGKPFELLEWEDRLIREMFGWKLDEHRLYRTVFLCIASGAGKTLLSCGIAAYLLFKGIPQAELLGVARDSRQAGRMFLRLKAMIEDSPALRDDVTFYKQPQRAEHVASGAVYSVLSKDTGQLWGANPSFIYIDEAHVIDAERVGQCSTLAAKQKDCLTLITTTAGTGDARYSPAFEFWDLTKRLAEGEERKDGTFLGVIYGASAEDEWDDINSAFKANPSLGISINEQIVKDEIEKCKQTPRLLNTYRTYRLNQWTEDMVSGLLDMEAWDRCSPARWKEEDLYGQECFGGLDLSSKIDLTCFALVFPQENETVKILPYFFLPEDDIVERSLRERIPYDQWHREGYLHLIPGPVIDNRFIKAFILEKAAQFKIRDISYDSWHASQLELELTEAKMTMVDIRQRFSSFSEPSKELQAMVKDARFDHNHHPILRSHASNAVVKSDDADNIRPIKPRDGVHIDGIIASIMALDGLIRRGRLKKMSVYDLRLLEEKEKAMV